MYCSMSTSLNLGHFLRIGLPMLSAAHALFVPSFSRNCSNSVLELKSSEILLFILFVLLKITYHNISCVNLHVSRFRH